MKTVIVALLMAGFCSVSADAYQVFRRRVRKSCNGQCQVERSVVKKKVVEKKVEKVESTKHPAQIVCEKKVAYMAQHRSRGHVLRHMGFGGGTFEGCGWSSGGMPGTCTPRGRRTLLGDAIAKDRYGYTYRVRIWR